ncbi:hypothetical protein SISSUDRAFT_439410 [Sistotremastrum suecicum HHB10207 ss-3]|uniref:Uncharacterized protein n=1 Tax=Sistotremastrum suecicum HHB10207 ss-3 TaxID=1314776 RepID=A0A166FJJ4_9AGAM|nr:hypothetical protein SISSUDRAFT_439410 [Sistotremastrum suecicum HHB10207 ss-3]
MTKRGVSPESRFKVSSSNAANKPKNEPMIRTLYVPHFRSSPFQSFLPSLGLPDIFRIYLVFLEGNALFGAFVKSKAKDCRSFGC